MLYDYLEAIYDGEIEMPENKVHRAMLYYMGRETGRLVKSDILKASSLAVLLRVSPTFMSNNKQMLIITAYDPDCLSAKELRGRAYDTLWNEAPELLAYAQGDTTFMSNIEDNYTIINGVPLFIGGKR